jgi:hypothetical protein
LTNIDQPDTERYNSVFLGNGQVGTLGTAIVIFNLGQPLGANGLAAPGQAANGITLNFNRVDSITINNGGIPDPSLASITIGGRINTGTGAFAGITNPAPSGATTTMTLTRISTSPLAYNLTLTGSATLNGSPVNLAINAVPVTQGIAAPNVSSGRQDLLHGNLRPVRRDADLHFGRYPQVFAGNPR